MKKIIIALGLALTLAAPAFALSQAECEARAVSKDGKPIYGAAKEASIKKCMGEAAILPYLLVHGLLPRLAFQFRGLRSNRLLIL
jgi:hypothetical protein